MFDFKKLNVSVIVPIYKAESFLSCCLQSLKQQTLQSIQFILIDDGSFDLGGAIADEFVLQNANTIVLHKVNGGLASARNRGIEIASGEYIAFLDSDDWVDTTTYEELYNVAIVDKPDIVFYRFHGDDLKKSFVMPRGGFYDHEQIEKEIIPFIMPTFDTNGKPQYIRWSSCLRLFNHSFINNNGLSFFEEAKTIEDFMFHVETVLLADSYYYYDLQPFYHAVENPKSMSRNYQPQMLTAVISILGRLRSIIDNKESGINISYYCQAALYFWDLCLANELSGKQFFKKVSKMMKSDIFCQWLSESKEMDKIQGWYGEVYDLLNQHSAYKVAYHFKYRPLIKRIIRGLLQKRTVKLLKKIVRRR